MAQTLRNPWILSFVTGEKTPKGSPCVQVIRLKQNREQGQHQQHVHVGLISDRFHYCHALISDEALKRHREATSASLQGALIQLTALRAEPSQEYTTMLIMVDDFEYIGSEGCETFGNPEDTSRVPSVISLCGRLRHENAVLGYEDCFIGPEELALLESPSAGWSAAADAIASSLSSTPQVREATDPQTLEDFHTSQRSVPVFEDIEEDTGDTAAEASGPAFTQCFGSGGSAATAENASGALPKLPQPAELSLADCAAIAIQHFQNRHARRKATAAHGRKK